ncbi:nucleotidyltransferase family protein [Brevibacillus centrosporus]|uniref:nucleotidyltransferase family protein n=1 Tax=Brevibacillus centrosporus TaxID=54910 RepID=UPI003D1CA548
MFTVIGHEAERISRSIPIDDPRFHWVFNPLYRSGQSASFKLGIRKALESHASVMVFLGDQPFVNSQTVHEVWAQGNRMLQAEQEPFVIQPFYREKTGHPVFFGNVNSHLFEELGGDQGAKPIIASMNRRILLPVDDPGIHFDIDSLADFEEAQHMR